MNALASTIGLHSVLATGEPAGGAALDQVAIATGAALVLSAAITWLGMGHRSGKVPYLGRAADCTERLSGLPGWAALPSALAASSLLVALLGMYWDISLHIDVGRDPGPLANPAHYLILAGLFGVFTAGYFAICLPKERPGPAARDAGIAVPVDGRDHVRDSRRAPSCWADAETVRPAKLLRLPPRVGAPRRENHGPRQGVL